MPNYVYSTIVFRGTAESIHKLIKIGLENSCLNSTGNMRRDFGLLVSEGKTLQLDEQNHSIKLEKRLTARTFLPIPETFLLYDTTNYPKQYPDAVKEQQEKYGVVGWYDYNKQTLGVKWNFDLTEADLQPLELSGIWMFSMDTETAWDYPDLWLVRIKEMVPELDVSIQALTGIDDDGEFAEFSGYVEDGIVKEGLSPMAIEQRRLMIEDFHREFHPTTLSVAINDEVNKRHPIIKEMKVKGYRLVAHDFIGNNYKNYTMILTFSKE